MTPEMMAQAEAIFHELMTEPGDRRADLARRRCAESSELLQEVLSLISTGVSDDFLARPAADIAGLWNAASTNENAQGHTDPLIGRDLADFTIEEQIGAGGMGVVYRARQRNPPREVAFKLIRRDLASASAARRFEHEAAILGRLQHPGIAQIYAAGRVDLAGGSRPYFAMELISGVALSAFAPPDRRARLDLFASICDAVHHAHTKVIIHRDLKPSNILVVETPTGPTPKILDFGVARAAESDLALTAQTAHGEVIGTLPYMSPEQVRGDPAEVDTRSDVYALGVILFELLAGRRPLGLTDRNLTQAISVITTAEPPKLGTIDRSLAGDLEIIAAKALEKDRDLRYQSASELAADIRRHLADVPLQARRPTAFYQFTKFATRNRGVVTAAAVAVVALIAGVAGTIAGLLRAQAREHDARIAASQATRTLDFLTTILTSANPIISRGRALTVRELVDDAAMRAATELADQPEILLRTNLALSRTYLSLNAADPAERLAQSACELASRVYGTRSLEYADALAAKVSAIAPRLKTEQTVTLAEEVLGLCLERLDARDRRVGRAHLLVARVLVDNTRFIDAEPHLKTAAEILQATGDREYVDCISTHADGLLRAAAGVDRSTEALAVLESALTEVKARGPSAEADIATLESQIGVCLTRLKRPIEAEAALRRAIDIRTRIFPPGHPATFAPRLRLGNLLRTQGKLDDARSLVAALVAEEERVLGSRSTDLINAYTVLGRIDDERGSLVDAAATYAKAVAVCRNTADRVQTLICLQQQGTLLVRAGHHTDAIPLLREALELARNSPKAGPAIPAIIRDLTAALDATGQTDEAAALRNDASADTPP